MGISRRDFLKISGSSLVLGALGAELSPAEAKERELRIKDAKETRTICPYCSVGCGIIVHSKGGKVVYAEGDPDHPINEGTLCSKGALAFPDHQQSAPPDEAEISRGRGRGLERSGVGLGAG